MTDVGECSPGRRWCRRTYLHTRSLLLTYQVSFTHILGLFYLHSKILQADGGVAGGAGAAVGLFYLHTRSLLLTYQVSFTGRRWCHRWRRSCSRASRERTRSKSSRSLLITQVSFTYITRSLLLTAVARQGNARAQNQPGRDSRKSVPQPISLYQLG